MSAKWTLAPQKTSVRAKIERHRPATARTVLYTAIQLDGRRLIWEHRDRTDARSDILKVSRALNDSEQWPKTNIVRASGFSR
jgi:hypothetical protein